MKKLFLLPLLASVAFAADAAPVVSAHYSTTDLVSVIVTALSIGVAYWRHSTASSLKKTLGSVAVAVEAFGASPAGAQVADTLKATIAATAKKHGVLELLDDVVQAVTPADLDAINKIVGPTEAPAAVPSTTPSIPVK